MPQRTKVRKKTRAREILDRMMMKMKSMRNELMISRTLTTLDSKKRSFFLSLLVLSRKSDTICCGNRAGPTLTTHSRTSAALTVRKPTDAVSARARARDAAKTKKEEDRAERREEVRRLKALKRQEVEAKLLKLVEAAGEGAVGLEEMDLEGDWDPDAHDAMMKKVYGEDYDGVAVRFSPVHCHEERKSDLSRAVDRMLNSNRRLKAMMVQNQLGTMILILVISINRCQTKTMMTLPQNQLKRRRSPNGNVTKKGSRSNYWKLRRKEGMKLELNYWNRWSTIIIN
jgi:hypothetical protein